MLGQKVTTRLKGAGVGAQTAGGKWPLLGWGVGGGQSHLLDLTGQPPFSQPCQAAVLEGDLSTFPFFCLSMRPPPTLPNNPAVNGQSAL